MLRFEISGGDDGAYGPAFGPVEAFEIEVVEDTGGVSYQLIQLLQSIHHGDAQIEYMTLLPRYKGDSIRRLRDHGCVVGIARVLPGKLDAVRAGHVSDNVEYWAVGTCKRIAT